MVEFQRKVAILADSSLPEAVHVEWFPMETFSWVEAACRCGRRGFPEDPKLPDRDEVKALAADAWPSGVHWARSWGAG